LKYDTTILVTREIDDIIYMSDMEPKLKEPFQMHYVQMRGGGQKAHVGGKKEE